MPVSRGRKPKRPARSAHRSGRPGASGHAEPDLATPLMKVLAALDDPLDAELLLSDAFGTAYEAQEYDKQAIVDSIATTLLGSAETSERPGAIELLAVLGSVGPEAIAERARAMVDVRLAAEPDLEHQPWVIGLTPLRCTRVLAMQDAFADATEYLVAFARGGPSHALLWMVDNNVGGGFARDVLVAGDADEIEAQLRELAATEDQIPVTVTEVDPAVLHGRLRRAMDLETRSAGPPEQKSYARGRMLAYGRLRWLPDPVFAEEVEALDNDARDRAVAEFLTAPEGVECLEELADDDRVRTLTRLLVDHAVDYTGGSPYRMTPSTVELFLLDWLPRKATLDDEDVELMPLVMESWAAYASRIEPLGPVDLVIATIAEISPQFDELMESAEQASPLD